MAYKRKTYDEYQVQQFTEDGWELATAAETYKGAKEHLKEYRENQPEYRYRIKTVRVKIEPEQ